MCNISPANRVAIHFLLLLKNGTLTPRPMKLDMGTSAAATNLKMSKEGTFSIVNLQTDNS